MPNGMNLPQGAQRQAGPSIEDVDRMLMEQIMALPPEAKIQLLQALSQAPQAPQASVQEQALGQVMGQATRGY